MTFRLEAPPRKPLPVIQRPVRDELLSSWLARCAHFYGVNALQIINHMGILWEPPPGHPTLSGRALRGLDFRPAASIARRLAWCLRVRESTIAKHTHSIGLSHLGSDSFVKIEGKPLPCRRCYRIFASTDCPATIKSWFEPWRIQCGRCLRPYNVDTPRRADRRDYPLYGPQKIPVRLWRDAIRGSELIDRWHRREPCGLFPPHWVLRILKQPLGNHHGPYNSRLLSALVPEAAAGIFKPKCFRSDLGAATLPHRVSILAGIARFNDTAPRALSQLTTMTTPAGRKIVNDLLNAMPSAIADELLGSRCDQAPRQNGALIVLAHTLSRKLHANLRQIEVLCRELE